MSVAHHLRGYYRTTGSLGFDMGIGEEMLPAVRAALGDIAHDPALIDPHELTREATARLETTFGLCLNRHRFHYFVEADEDWRLVAESQRACA
jgi:hypothetical protein